MMRFLPRTKASAASTQMIEPRYLANHSKAVSERGWGQSNDH